MSINQSEESLLQKRKADIAKQAAGGSLQAIAKMTGVSRQTLYRWRRGGMVISNDSVRKRIATPSRSLNGGKQRGPRLGSFRTAFLPGFCKRERLQAKKDLNRAISDMAAAIHQFNKSGAEMSQKNAMQLEWSTRRLVEMLPADFFLPIPT